MADKEYTLVFSLANGTKHSIPFVVPQGDKGEKGDKGDKGDQGEQGKQGIQGIQGEPGTKGKDGADGYSPIKGTDYFTDTDKSEMVQAVISALPVYNGEVTTI